MVALWGTVSIRDFYRRTVLLPRLALGCAFVAAGLNLASYVGLTMRGPFEWLAVVHLVVMALAVALFIRMGRHHWLAARSTHATPPTPRAPRSLVLGTALSLVYVLVLFLGMLAVHGEGAAEIRDGHEVWVVRDTVVRALPAGAVAKYASQELRVFSAAWLFVGLLIAVDADRIEARIRAYRASARR